MLRLGGYRSSGWPITSAPGANTRLRQATISVTQPRRLSTRSSVSHGLFELDALGSHEAPAHEPPVGLRSRAL